MRKFLTLCIAVFMVMQVVLPTLSQAVDTIKLNIQSERPYSDDDGDGVESNDIYTLARQATQTLFKIGEQIGLDEDGKPVLNHDNAYYCLRGGLGFGSETEILEEGLDYTKLTDLSDSEAVKNYYRNVIGIDAQDLSDEELTASYNAICWIAENMYLPNHENAEELKEILLENAGITNSQLTDDDIEVVQQMALWYFTNYDENGAENSVSLNLTGNLKLSNLLKINDESASNDTEILYNKNRAKQIDALYEYFINNAKAQHEEITKVPASFELDKNLEPTIEEKNVQGTRVNAFIVGPFQINELQEANIENTFSYALKYKRSSTEETWSTLEIDNTTKTVFLSDENGTVLDSIEDVSDMIEGNKFYVTILKDILNISNISEFRLDIAYESHYYTTTSEVYGVVDAKGENILDGNGKLKDQPVLKVQKTKVLNSGNDNVIITSEEKEFDLSLRKYISNIERKGEKVELASRVPQVDTTPLTQNISTATYIHPKNILTVKQGDIITYKLRVYNEGELDGYAKEITDYIPEGLGLLVGYSGNSNWLIKSSNIESKPLVGENGIYKTEQEVPTQGIFENEKLASISVVTNKDGALEIRDYLSLKDKIIKKYGTEARTGDLFQVSTSNQNDGLFYQEIEVTCIVLAPSTYSETITNIAEISIDKAVEMTLDENNEEVEIEVNVDDRDSRPGNVMEDGMYTPGTELNGYTPGEQDDDDFEPIQLKYFDLALRKFITGVNGEVVNTRIPEVIIDEEGNIIYEHTKEPVEVVDNDNVTYTIRVYNEGTIAGFAEEIEDDIPEGLIFLPDDETNKQYGWKMYYYDEEGFLVETENVEEASVIRTTFLAEENGTVNQETGLNSNLVELFDRETMELPDYRDIKVVFKASQKNIPEENEDGIIINKAHITDDSDDDEDSIPEEWNEGEDDQDIEKIKVQKFDLALFKWVSKTSVTVDNKTTTTETGFKPNIGKTEASGEDYRENSQEEPIASVTIDKKKINSTTVKFVYNIKILNEGDIAGFATEITDYIPQGLKFVAEDNPLWTQTEDGKITTRALETKLLNPGESAEVPVTFTWINDANNLGLKTNIAAITEDYNEKGIADEDSIPGNEDIPNYEKEQEDDDDFALVILTLKTGSGISYIWLGLVTVTIITLGAILIKKYVL